MASLQSRPFLLNLKKVKIVDGATEDCEAISTQHHDFIVVLCSRKINFFNCIITFFQLVPH